MRHSLSWPRFAGPEPGGAGDAAHAGDGQAGSGPAWGNKYYANI